jgi:hypothetical protein
MKKSIDYSLTTTGTNSFKGNQKILKMVYLLQEEGDF